MDRRTWLAGSVGLLAAPLIARAQPQAKPFRIGLLGSSPPTRAETAFVWGALFHGLRELGYVEGQNVAFEGRWYEDSAERLPALAEELVRLQVDVIVAGAAPAPEAAARATSTIPIVMPIHADPVGSGLATSLAKPGGNVTGLSMATTELRSKQLHLLKELVSGLVRVAILRNPAVPVHALDMKALETAARPLKLQLQDVAAATPGDFTRAIAAATKRRAGALLVLGGSLFFVHRAQLAALAARSRLPAMYGAREYVEAGGLISYSPDLRESYRRAAWYVDRILKGAKAGDLPIEQPTKFDLVISQKAVSTLRLKVPPSILTMAEQIIE